MTDDQHPPDLGALAKLHTTLADLPITRQIVASHELSPNPTPTGPAAELTLATLTATIALIMLTDLLPPDDNVPMSLPILIDSDDTTTAERITNCHLAQTIALRCADIMRNMPADVRRETLGTLIQLHDARLANIDE